MIHVSVTLPVKLLEDLDRKLIKGKSSRSAVVRHLLEQALSRVEERDDIERYVKGYREHPQTEDEFGWSDHASREHLAELPWQ